MRKSEKIKVADLKWSLSAKRTDSTKFFRQMGKLFYSGESVYIEGSCISQEAEQIYDRYKKSGRYLPGNGTIWPKSKTFVCMASVEFFDELAELSRNKAEPELFDHFFIYKNQNPVVQWWDAFSGPIILSSEIAEDDVQMLAAELGLTVEKSKKPPTV